MPTDPRTDGANVLAFPQAPEAIELRHLRAFVAVAEELNFSRAADRLHISQSALSRQISSLEKLIGCDLLRRSTHRVELTLAGEALLERTRSLLEGFDEAVSTTQSVGGELAFRLAQYWAPVFATAGSRDLARRAPRRDRGSVRPVPTARGDRGRAGQRRGRRLVSDRPRRRPPGDRPLPARRRPHLRLLLRPPWRDRRRRRCRGRDRARARVPPGARASVPRRPRGRGARLRVDGLERGRPEPDRDRRRLVRCEPRHGAAPEPEGQGRADARGRGLVLSLGRHHRQHPADREQDERARRDDGGPGAPARRRLPRRAPDRRAPPEPAASRTSRACPRC